MQVYGEHVLMWNEIKSMSQFIENLLALFTCFKWRLEYTGKIFLILRGKFLCPFYSRRRECLF